MSLPYGVMESGNIHKVLTIVSASGVQKNIFNFHSYL